MPSYLQPKKSTQHRVAAIALYRALLAGCTSAPLPDDDRVSLRNAIRNKFRKNRKIQSAYQLSLSFKAGYETLDHLDASSTGDATSLGVLTSLISQLPRGLTRSSKAVQRLSKEPPKERQACLPPERAVLNVRPYAKTSGPRHVPIMSTANGIPFLRLTKPQPPALSRVIYQRQQRSMYLFDQKIELANWWLPLAKQEDEWDTLINTCKGKDVDAEDGAQGDGVRWTDAVTASEENNLRMYYAEQAKSEELRRKMQRIVDLETKLALQEGQTIIRGRKKKPIKVIKPPNV